MSVAGYHTCALALFEIVGGQPRPLRLPADAFDLDGVLPELPMTILDSVPTQRVRQRPGD
jgi:hypothetical protein